MLIKAVIVEDEFKVRELFIILLRKFCKEITIVGEANNINDGYDLIKLNKPDVIFLDIEMPGGNGFELLAKFEKVFFETIFVSSYGHYAIRAIKACALDYLLKPVIIEDLKKITTRLQEKIELKGNALKYNLLQENLVNTDYPQKLIITTRSKIESVDTNDILYLKAEGNYTNIHLKNNTSYCISKTLKEYEEILCEEKTPFIRIHKAIIVNTRFIRHITRGDDYVAVLYNNVNLEISRRKRQEVIIAYNKNSINTKECKELN